MASKWVSIDDIQPGMIAANAVSDREGRIIIPQGGRLTPMAIKRLPRWGIIGVDILLGEEGGSEQDASASSGAAPGAGASREEQDAEFLFRVTAQVEERFASLEANPFNNEYKQIITRCLLEKGRGVVPGL